MHPSVSALVETTYGTLRVCAGDRHHLVFRTVDPHQSTEAIEQIVVSRVAYRLRVGLVSTSRIRPSDRWDEQPVALPALDGTGFAIRQGDLLHALLRVTWERHEEMYGTDAARRELTSKLLPQLAAWLTSDEATAVLAEAERRALDHLAAEAANKAAALRAAADELDVLRARAAAGEDLDAATRSRIRHSFRLTD